MTSDNRDNHKRHPKQLKEKNRDHQELKQAALLWWAQSIYELLRETDGKNRAAALGTVRNAITKLAANGQGYAPDLQLPLQNVNDERVVDWWYAHELFQAANSACSHANAYDLNPIGNQAYSDITGTEHPNSGPSTLKTLAITLKKNSTARLKLRRDLIDTPRPPVKATNCNSDDECPNDYLCEEGVCESILPIP